MSEDRNIYPELPPSEENTGVGKMKRQGGIYPDLSPDTEQDQSVLRQRPMQEGAQRAEPQLKRGHGDDDKQTKGKWRKDEQNDDKHRLPFDFQSWVPRWLQFTAALGCLLAFVLIVLCPLRQDSPATSEEPPLTQREQMFQSMKQKFKKVSTGFPSQSTDFWVTIQASVLAQMKNPEPPQPAAFLLPVSDNTLPTATCLTRRLAEIITQTYEGKAPVNINVTDMVQKESSDEVKLFLDNTLDTGLKDDSRVVLVNDLEKIPPPAALIFHGYCDNENAPYKDAVFFYVVHFPGQPLEENKGLAQNKMEDMWSLGLEPARYMPVLARIGRNIAFVRPEADETLRTECGASP